MVWRHNGYFTKEGSQMVTEHMKICSTSLSSETTAKTIMRYL